MPATLLHCRQIELDSLRPGVSHLQERIVSLFPYTKRPTLPVKKETFSQSIMALIAKEDHLHNRMSCSFSYFVHCAFMAHFAREHDLQGRMNCSFSCFQGRASEFYSPGISVCRHVVTVNRSEPEKGERKPASRPVVNQSVLDSIVSQHAQQKDPNINHR